MWALGCILYEIWTQDSSFVTESFGMATKLGKDREMINRLEDIAIVQLLGIISILSILPILSILSILCLLFPCLAYLYLLLYFSISVERRSCPAYHRGEADE